MLKNILLALCCIWVAPSFAQNIEFLNQYSEPCRGCRGNDIIAFADGTALIAATADDKTGTGQTDILLIKIKTNGDTLWTRQVGLFGENEHSEAILMLPDNKIIIAGNTTNGIANTDALLLCTDSTGTIYWRRTYGGGALDGITTMKKLSDGYILGGTTHSSGAGAGDAWLIRTNNTGDVKWNKTYGGTSYDDCWDMELAAGGGYVFTGGTYSFAQGLYDDAWINRTDTSGNLVWRKTYGLRDRVDWAWAITPVTDQSVITGYAFVGIKNTEPNNPGAMQGDLHFVKTDTAGTVIWDKSIMLPAGSYRKEGTDIQQAPDGSFTITGYQLTSAAQQLYIIRASADGIVIWDTTIGFQAAFRSTALAHTPNGDVIITGYWQTAPNVQYIFAAKVTNMPTTIQPVNVEHEISVYPNPANGHVTLSCSNNVCINSIELYDLAGRMLQTVSPAGAGTVNIQLQPGLSGFMMLKISTDKGTMYKKLLAQ